MEPRISEAVIGCAIAVHKTLGRGFLERIYESALAIELRLAGLAFERQKALAVRYRGEIVGDYCCDFVVEDRLILELKALSSLTTDHEAQVLNYLKAGAVKVGLLLNFGTSKLGIKRLVLDHDDAFPI